MAERQFPDMEIKSSLEGDGGWLSWIGAGMEAIPALRWKSAQGDDLPEELIELCNVLVSFGLPPHEEAVSRVQGLEKAFAEIAEHIEHGGISGNTSHVLRIKEIVRSCVKYSGAFDTEYQNEDAPQEPESE